MVGIILGSDSDLGTMGKAAELLERFGVSYEMRILSAHRQPEELKEYAKKAEGRGIKVLIAGAGLSAALPGMLAAYSMLPVIGVPMGGQALAGMDSLFSIAQMPPGVPVGCMGIGGAVNAALFALRILALEDPGLRKNLALYQQDMEEKNNQKDQRLAALGYKDYKGNAD
ncbi:MAG: 5-(carboxyamino)imidazole ribonucleotide mutase [Lachnospiraceae bacterium]|nr:5-(carboxyamino)imidazole ribonucleotide mutase [Lachnospiraceae bacterium]